MQCHQETPIPDRSFLQQAYQPETSSYQARKAQPWLESPGAQVGYDTATGVRGSPPRGAHPCTPTGCPPSAPH